jgi:ABC-type Zn uptake system ZnuABC Zn-binding protein ZnuA
VWLDPANAEIMCRNIAAALEAADPQAGEAYQEGLASYLERLGETTRRLRQIVQTLPDRRFLSYHAAWPYFARGMGFQVVGVVTEMPGQEPSAKALAGLLERIRTEQIRVLATEPQLSSKIPDLLAQESGIRTVTLSPLLGAGPAKTYLELLEADTRALAQALGGPRP